MAASQITPPLCFPCESATSCMKWWPMQTLGENITLINNNCMSSKCGKLCAVLHIASQHSKKHLRRLMVTYRVHRRVPLQKTKRGVELRIHCRSHDGSVISSGFNVETKQEWQAHSHLDALQQVRSLYGNNVQLKKTTARRLASRQELITTVNDSFSHRVQTVFNIFVTLAKGRIRWKVELTSCSWKLSH